MHNHLAGHFCVAVVAFGLTCAFHPEVLCRRKSLPPTEGLMRACQVMGIAAAALGLVGFLSLVLPGRGTD